MIDNIKLKLNRFNFNVTNPKIFGKGKFNLNTRLLIKKWHYTDNGFSIEILKKYSELNMYISFSAPILLFGNNLDELEEMDFSLLIDALINKLNGLGVIVERRNLENSEVSMVHISKNFIIKNYTCSNVIYHMSKVNVSYMRSLRKSYLNNGESLYFENDSHMICIYNKLEQLKNKMQKIDDTLSFDSEMLGKINNLKYKNILRVEIRLLDGDKIKNFFDSENISFKDIFKKKIWQEIISSYMYRILDNKNMFLFEEYDPIEKMLKILETNPNIKFNKLIYTIGLNSMCKNPNGLARFLDIISKTYSKDQVKNIKKDLWFLSEFNYKTYQYKFINDIKKQLKDLKSLRLVNIKKEKGVKNIGGKK